MKETLELKGLKPPKEKSLITRYRLGDRSPEAIEAWNLYHRNYKATHPPKPRDRRGEYSRAKYLQRKMDRQNPRPKTSN